MSAIITNLEIEQGATFTLTVALNDANNNPLNTSSYTSQAAMRQDYQSSNVYSFATSLANGALTLSMTANTTANIPPGRYVYDAYMINSNGYVARVVEGLVDVSPEVTNYANVSPWPVFPTY
jgi:hypothetical protein